MPARSDAYAKASEHSATSERFISATSPTKSCERLERIAARDATSVSAAAVRELAEVTRRADNAALLGALPDHGVPARDLVDDVNAGREAR